MKTFNEQILCLVLCTAMCGVTFGEPSSSLPLIVEASPAIPVNTSTKHLPTSTIYHNSSTVHHNESSTVHHNVSSTVHNVSSTVHNVSSTIHHNVSSTVHNVSSTIHHNVSSTVHNVSSTIHHNVSSTVHNVSSTIHHNVSSTIMPSPSVNYSISINMTSATHNASHMTYTVSPTHSISPNATSTVVPSSSPVPTTTPPPTPNWPKGKFSVKKGNDSCLLMWLSLEFTVKYKNDSSGEMITHDVIMPNSSSATAVGTCDSGMSTIHISWGGFYYLEATFITTKIVDLSAEQFHWTTKNLTMYAKVHNNSAFADANQNVTEIKETITDDEKKLGWLSGYTGRSLNCSGKETVEFGNSITANFENVRIQPFAVKKDQFSEKVDVCSNPQTTTAKPTVLPSDKKPSSSNTVAIAVGCSLGGLVLIVLIGYLIGRRRKNAIRYRKL